jgi:hypothetical protein
MLCSGKKKVCLVLQNSPVLLGSCRVLRYIRGRGLLWEDPPWWDGIIRVWLFWALDIGPPRVTTSGKTLRYIPNVRVPEAIGPGYIPVVRVPKVVAQGASVSKAQNNHTLIIPNRPWVWARWGGQVRENSNTSGLSGKGKWPWIEFDLIFPVLNQLQSG